MKVFNIKVYGIEQSLIRAGYPYQTEVNEDMDTMIAQYSITPQMLARGKKLGNTDIGSGHSNYLKGIIVQMDITAPQYWWQQAQRYHWFDIISSQSKMHKLTEMNLGDMLYSGVGSTAIKNVQGYIEMYNDDKCDLEDILDNLPMGFEYTAGITTNYLQLRTMHSQRRNHRLSQWQIFCDVVEQLPLFKMLCLGGLDEE